MEKGRTREAWYKTVTGKETLSAHKMFEMSIDTEPEGECTSYIETRWNPEEEISQ